MMTLNQIKAMFVDGSTWRVTRKSEPAYRNDGETLRRVLRTTRVGVQWVMPDGKKIMYMDWPKMREVEAAKDGFLVFQYTDVPCRLSLVRETGGSGE